VPSSFNLPRRQRKRKHLEGKRAQVKKKKCLGVLLRTEKKRENRTKMNPPNSLRWGEEREEEEIKEEGGG